MRALLPFLVVGITTGSLYGLTAVGLVLTYRTSGVFNFGHGAIAAAAAYLFYELHVTRGLAWPIAALVAVFGFGVVAGVLVNALTRQLAGAAEALVIVATVGLLLAIDGFLLLRYGSVSLPFPQFLPAGGVVVSGVRVSYPQMISVVIAAVGVAALSLFLKQTRLGVSMKAAVDNPTLLSLAAGRPARVQRVAWIIGCSFAALSGILIAPIQGLDALLLTLLVVQAFGAAALGAFKSLPLTYAGGVLVGVLASVSSKYLGQQAVFRGVPISVPFLVLIVVLLVVPAGRFPRSRARTRALSTSGAGPRLRVSSRWLAGPALVGLLLVPHLVGSKLPVWIAALVMLILFGSLSLLVGTSGQISLSHTAFAALGATTFGHLTTDAGVPWAVALVLAGASAVPLGALVSTPAIRVSGIYLALATFGCAILTQFVLYPTDLMFGTDPYVKATRPHLGFINGTEDRTFYYVVLAVAVLTCAVLAGVNRSRLGRLLRGLSESPTMLTTHGLRVNRTRVIVFCLSAFFAGVAGALASSQASAVGTETYQPIHSLLWLAVLAICGTQLILSSALAASLWVLVPGYLNGFGAEEQMFTFGALTIVAVLVMAKRAELRTLVTRASQASVWRRADSPVLHRRDQARPAADQVVMAP